jgi:hypothetical protein
MVVLRAVDGRVPEVSKGEARAEKHGVLELSVADGAAENGA